VAQEDTLIRIALRPFRMVPPHQQVPSACTASITLLVIPLPTWCCLTEGDDSFQSKSFAVDYFLKDFVRYRLGQFGKNVAAISYHAVHLWISRRKRVNRSNRAVRFEMQLGHLDVAQMVLVRELRVCIEEPPLTTPLHD
jgi:hypothetical protein